MLNSGTVENQPQMFWYNWLLTCKFLVAYCVIEWIACYVCLLLQKFYTRVSVNYEVVFKAVIYKGLGLCIFPFMTLDKYPVISIYFPTYFNN